MADNNLARSRNDLPDFFADDDPLAELARIVGYEDRPVAKPVAAPVPRREPAFNLEDELLREFEQYDAPRLDPANDIVIDDAPRHAIEPPALFEPSFEPQEPRFVPEARFVAEESVELAPAFEAAPSDARVDVDPFEDVEFSRPDEAVDEIFAEAPLFEPAAEQVRFKPIFDLPDVPVAGPVSALPIVSQPEPEAAAEEFDLAAELESSIGAEPVVAAESASPLAPQPEIAFSPAPLPTIEPNVKPEPKAKGYVPGFRMPLANFNPAREAAPAPQPVSPVRKAEELKFDLPVLVDLPAPKPAPQPTEASLSFEKPPLAAKVDPVVQAAVLDDVKAEAPVAITPARTSASSIAVSEQLSALDELIYDVQRYSLTPSTPKSAATPIEAPVAKAPEVQPAAVIVVPAPLVAPIEALVDVPVEAKTPVAAPSVKAPAAVEEKDPFADEEFELALDDLELDLAEIVIEESVEEPAKAAAPVAKAEAPVARAEVSVDRGNTVASAAVVAAAVEPVADDVAAGELPFDPAQIAESEDQVEAIAELDVPELPVEEPEEPIAYRPEYDLDIDAELATLLASANKPEPAAPARNPAVDIAATSHRPGSDRNPHAAPQSNYAELDAFERALEEDFRRSLAAPLAPAEHEELHYADSDYVSTVENARRSVRSWVVPLVVAGVVILGGAGAYALIGKGVPGVSSGDPVIIVADTDPIKVAPENPGGKTVPNQDKAVYDRVAGLGSADPKQRQLISTNEKPVDVVQKTLMPDTLPLEGENDIDPTDVGETQDPRLLPNQGQQSAAANSGAQQPVTVMPRKVKTMIVRADGKLVEQEMPAPALAAPETAKVPAAGAKPVETAAAAVRPQPVPAINAAGIVPVSAPVMPAVALPAQPQPTAAPKPATPAPVAAAKPATPAPAAPVVAAPTAAAMPASQPAAPAAASARAPVPGSRPADQPVNVVAAVSDQGAVRAPAQAAAPTQVASLGDGGYVIQIASLPSQAEAQKSYQSLSSKFGNVIGGRGVDIKSAEVAGKGTFYRVRIPAGSKDNAVALCEKYRAAGGSCLVAK